MKGAKHGNNNEILKYLRNQSPYMYYATKKICLGLESIH